MYIIRGFKNIPSRFRGSVVTIGNFDGIHQGHQAVFRQLRQLARIHGDVPTLAVTFEPHPLKLLVPERAPVRITGVRGKSRWMARHDVDAMFILRFTRELAALDPESFVRRVLREQLAAREVLVGKNFRFGAGRAGDFNELERLGKRFGFGVHCQPLFEADGVTVSSTRIRNLVTGGRFEAAAQLLGREFEIEGRVTQGHKRGRGLGFPTANLALTDMLHPPPGVYVVEGRINGNWLPAVANLGRNPTYGDTDLHLEVHLMAACGDLYRRVLRIRFLKHLRPEVKFATPQALKEQITRDVDEARAFFTNRTHQRGTD